MPVYKVGIFAVGLSFRLVRSPQRLAGARICLPALQKDSRRASLAGMTMKNNVQIIDTLRFLPQVSSLYNSKFRLIDI